MERQVGIVEWATFRVPLEIDIDGIMRRQDHGGSYQWHGIDTGDATDVLVHQWVWHTTTP